MADEPPIYIAPSSDCRESYASPETAIRSRLDSLRLEEWLTTKWLPLRVKVMYNPVFFNPVFMNRGVGFLVEL